MNSICNYDDILEHFDNNIELLNNIYTKYKSNSSELLTKLDTAIQESQIDEVSILAHTLKGSTSNFFVDDLVAVLQHLELNTSKMTKEEMQEDFQKASTLFLSFTEFFDGKLKEA